MLFRSLKDQHKGFDVYIVGKYDRKDHTTKQLKKNRDYSNNSKAGKYFEKYGTAR